jgi:hypothetical protein
MNDSAPEVRLRISLYFPKCVRDGLLRLERRTLFPGDGERLLIDRSTHAGEVTRIRGLVGRVAMRSSRPPMAVGCTEQTYRPGKISVQGLEGGLPIEAVRQRLTRHARLTDYLECLLEQQPSSHGIMLQTGNSTEA